MPTHRLAPGFALVATLAILASPAAAQLKLPRVSPNATVTQTVGVTNLSISYSRPGVKNRTIWGELVPYDKPWRTGANEATNLTLSTDVTFGGQQVAAGSYALVTIPGKDEWTVALNSEKELWGAFAYKPERDVVRVKVKPAAAEHEEWMRFSFENLTANSADLVLRWEKLAVSVPIAVDLPDTVLGGARTSLAAAKADDWRMRVSAARWCLDNDQALAEGRGWLDQALAITKNYSTLGLLARWQAKEGKTKDAIASAALAIEDGKKSADKPDMTSLEKLVAEWKAK